MANKEERRTKDIPREKSIGEIVVLGDETMVTGFRLAGVTKYYNLEGEEAEKKLRELMESDVNIIVVSERILFEADWRLRRRVEAMAKPIVVPVPDKLGPVEEAEAESLRELIKRALGFDLIGGGGIGKAE